MGNKKNYKSHETRAAKLFTTKRAPFSGLAGGVTHSDSLHKRLFLECKKREKHAVITLYKKTAELAQKENKIPIVSLKEHNSRECYYIFEEKDLFNILKEIDLSLINKDLPQGTILNKLQISNNNGILKEFINDLYNIIKKYTENI